MIEQSQKQAKIDSTGRFRCKYGRMNKNDFTPLKSPFMGYNYGKQDRESGLFLLEWSKGCDRVRFAYWWATTEVEE